MIMKKWVFPSAFSEKWLNQIILGERTNFSILEVSEQELQALDLLRVANY